MAINRKLNITFTLVRESDGVEVNVHATPISRAVFEEHFVLLSQVFTLIYKEGMEVVSGPKIAALLLKKVAKQAGPDTEQAATRLLSEMQRLANVALPSPDGKGYATMPLYTALSKGLIDEEDAADVEGFLCFFTCVSSLHRREHLPGILKRMGLWGVETTSSDFTAYVASLPTLTTGEDTTSKMAVSSVPS